jgi:hypothetical protein
MESLQNHYIEFKVQFTHTHTHTYQNSNCLVKLLKNVGNEYKYKMKIA